MVVIQNYLKEKFKMKFISKLAIVALLAVNSIAAQVTEITSLAQLQQLVNNNSRVVVKFYANYCAPCKRYAPIFSDVSNNGIFKDVVFVQVNSETQNAIFKIYNVRSMPTTLVIRNGSVVNTFMGAKNYSDLQSLLRSALSL